MIVTQLCDFGTSSAHNRGVGHVTFALNDAMKSQESVYVLYKSF